MEPRKTPKKTPPQGGVFFIAKNSKLVAIDPDHLRQ
jgi:hypothetical protein